MKHVQRQQSSTQHPNTFNQKVHQPEWSLAMSSIEGMKCARVTRHSVGWLWDGFALASGGFRAGLGLVWGLLKVCGGLGGLRAGAWLHGRFRIWAWPCWGATFGYPDGAPNFASAPALGWGCVCFQLCFRQHLLQCFRLRKPPTKNPRAQGFNFLKTIWTLESRRRLPKHTHWILKHLSARVLRLLFRLLGIEIPGSSIIGPGLGAF